MREEFAKYLSWEHLVDDEGRIIPPHCTDLLDHLVRERFVVGGPERCIEALQGIQRGRYHEFRRPHSVRRLAGRENTEVDADPDGEGRSARLRQAESLWAEGLTYCAMTRGCFESSAPSLLPTRTLPGAGAIADAAVLVRDGRIVAVGAAADPSTNHPDAAEIGGQDYAATWTG
jgi:hypothetical protein